MQEVSGYKSIALDIAQRIVSGEFAVNSKLSGRTLLASQYRVSPETIRKAISLLKDEDIVSVSQGKEIIVLSERLALDYITRHNYMKSVYSLKQDLELLLREKKRIDQQFESFLTDIINFSDRLQNLKPYHPEEFKVKPNSCLVGKTIASLDFWEQTGATIVALRRGTNVTISPGPHAIIHEDDIIVIVGDGHAHQRTEAFVNRIL